MVILDERSGVSRTPRGEALPQQGDSKDSLGELIMWMEPSILLMSAKCSTMLPHASPAGVI